jgi:Zinc-binding dehydrogenase
VSAIPGVDAAGVIAAVGHGVTGYRIGDAVIVWSQAGIFRVNIDHTFELTGALKAWQYSQAGHTRGKSVIRIND